MSSDWFERLTGFKEEGYRATQMKLTVEGDELFSGINGRRYGIGRLELATLAALREHAPRDAGARSRVSVVQGEVRDMHARPEFEGALFQVASQFNLLEMPGPDVTPEAGVTGYWRDGTQGPACAMAAGAATIYRNYFAPVGEQAGQTASRQIDALAGLGDALSRRLGRPVSSLWEMKNGYALGTPDGLEAIGDYLSTASEEERQRLRGELAIGLHRDVQVTDVEDRCVKVSQAFCSALPLGYSSVAVDVWEPLARLVLEASYEATLLAAAEQAARGGSRIVLLTRIGGGVYRNPSSWITEAILRALHAVEHAGLDVRMVCYSGVDAETRFLMHQWVQLSESEPDPPPDLRRDPCINRSACHRRGTDTVPRTRRCRRCG